MQSKNPSNYHESLGCECGLSAIDGMGGHEFEYFCADLLRKIGFLEVRVTPGSGDQGVDILAIKDGIKYAIQCKNYASSLSNTPVQEVSAGKQFYGCHVGVVMTNSTFTSGAVQLAEANNVLLWDRAKLEKFIIEAGGLGKLGFHSEPSNLECEKISINKFSSSIESPIKKSRKGMKMCSTICYSWSGLCVLAMFFSFITRDTEMIRIAISEGLFFWVFGYMFNVLAESEKNNPFIFIFGVRISKWVFVILCIIVAYILFLPFAITME